jgi:hypothetical protein
MRGREAGNRMRNACNNDLFHAALAGAGLFLISGCFSPITLNRAVTDALTNTHDPMI